MPRVKSSDQIDSIKRQQKELFAKLKEAKIRARAEAKELEDRRAMIAGRALLRELQENPSGPHASSILSVLNARLTRPSDRGAFGLHASSAEAEVENAPKLTASTPAPPQSQSPEFARAHAETA